jgi:hypothetical protein
MPYKNKIPVTCPSCGTVRMKFPNYRISSKSDMCHACANKIAGKARDRGYTSHPLYQRWQGMKARCTYTGHKDWEHYGGRGVTVCDEWQDFSAFRDWAEENWHGLTLDRIDNDKGYSPDNCKWSTASEQCVNRRPWTKTSS